MLESGSSIQQVEDESMRNEGYVQIDSRRVGFLAFLRHKQWWYFEGLDPQ